MPSSLLARALAVLAAGLALLAPGVAAGRDAPGTSPGELLESVIKHYRNGELERAWEAYRAFFSHPGNGDVDVNAFGNCFYKGECPAVGLLAHVLGKHEAEADDLRSFCPTWEGADASGHTEEQLIEARQILAGFVSAAFGGRTCAQWADLNARRFHSRPGRWPKGAQSIPLAPPRADDRRPVAEMVVAADQRLAVLVDTGATTASLVRERIDDSSASIEVVGEVVVIHIMHHSLRASAKVDWLQLGSTVFERPIVGLSDEPVFWGAEKPPLELDGIVGMNLLLQYESVCFDWERRTLHLGELGPCESGLMPDRAWLDGALRPTVEAANTFDGVARAVIDTGAVGTVCSHGFVRPDADSEPFSFGRDARLQGECAYDSNILFDNWNWGDQVEGNHMMLGMATLGKFAAFGWRLNPLRVYFVPKPAGANLAGRQGPQP